MRTTDRTTKQQQTHPKRGQATVEFALVLIVMLAVLYGIIEISRLMLVNAQIENAAREGAHYAALHPGVDKGCVSDRAIKPRMTLIDTSDARLVVGVTWSMQASGQKDIKPFYPITVTVNYTWTSLVNIMPDMNTLTLRPLGPLHLQSSAVALIENAATVDVCPQQ